MKEIERRLPHRNRPYGSRDLQGGRIAPPHQLTSSRKPTSNRVKIPSLALKLGHSINKSAAIIHAKALEQGRNTERIEQFIKLHELEWTESVQDRAIVDSGRETGQVQFHLYRRRPQQSTSMSRGVEVDERRV